MVVIPLAPMTPQRREARRRRQRFLPGEADDLRLTESLHSVRVACVILAHGFTALTDAFGEMQRAIEEREYDASD